jgi:hypothetical protein
MFIFSLPLEDARTHLTWDIIITRRRRRAGANYFFFFFLKKDQTSLTSTACAYIELFLIISVIGRVGVLACGYRKGNNKHNHQR